MTAGFHPNSWWPCIFAWVLQSHHRDLHPKPFNLHKSALITSLLVIAAKSKVGQASRRPRALVTVVKQGPLGSTTSAGHVGINLWFSEVISDNYSMRSIGWFQADNGLEGFRKRDCSVGCEKCESERFSVVSDCLWPHRLYSPWDSPGQNTGVGSLSLLQGIFLTQGSNPGLPHCRWILYQLNHKGSPRILEWIVYPFSSGSSWPRNWTGVSPALQANSLPTELSGKPLWVVPGGYWKPHPHRQGQWEGGDVCGSLCYSHKSLFRVCLGQKVTLEQWPNLSGPQFP